MSDTWAQNTTPTTNGRRQRRWVVLAVVLTGAFMILLDATIVNVAVPPIQKDLHAGNDALEWIVAGYALAYGLLLIPAGRLGDRFGHKLVFLIGMAGFTVASALCAIADTPDQLVGWRILQGFMAGVMNPPILALIQAAFPPQETGKAYGLYGAVAGVSTASGPLIGGLLIQWNLNGWDWRPVFMINVPIGILAFLAAIWLVPESKGQPGAIDAFGVLLITAALLLLTYPLVEGRYLGWPAWTFVSMAASVPVLGLFALWEFYRERRGKVPLVSMKLFKHASVSAGSALSVLYFAGFIGLLFALTLYFQIGLDKSPLAAGLSLLPFPAGTFVGAAISNNIAHKLGRRVLFLGAALVIVGILGIAFTVHYVGTSGLELLPAMAVGGFGSGLIIAPSTEIVLAGVPWQYAGAASGVLTTAQRLGQAIGIAVIGVILFSALGSHAGASAATTEAQLRQQLSAASISGPAADQAVNTFTDCFKRQSNATDPTATPPGCPAPDTSNPAGAAFSKAASAALKDNFVHSIQIAALSTLVAVVLTYLLVFFLPKKAAEPWSGEGGSGDWGGGGGSGDWSGGGDASSGQWSAGASSGEWKGTDGSSGSWSNEGGASSGEWKAGDGSSGSWNTAGDQQRDWKAGSPRD